MRIQFLSGSLFEFYCAIFKVHESTGCTPNEFLLIKEIRLPLDIFLVPHQRNWKLHDVRNMYMHLRNCLEAIHQFARNHLRMESEHLKYLYDQRSYGNSYVKGEKVWLQNPQKKKGRSQKVLFVSHQEEWALCRLVITWYKNRHTGTQIAHWDIFNEAR